MTTSEKKLTAALLRLAADQFHNHGCNDFNLSEYITSADARDALVLDTFGELFGEKKADDEADYRLGDSWLMEAMAKRLEADCA
jgi:hypothetical protein